MQFTTTTEIARKGSKIFSNYSYATVLNNNTDIGLLIGTDLYKLIMERGILEDLLEDLEMQQNKQKLQKKYQDSSESGLSNITI